MKILIKKYIGLLSILSSLLLVPVYYAYSATFSCSYIFSNDSYPVTFKKVGNEIHEISQLRKIKHNILYEDETLITFGTQLTYDDDNRSAYQVTILNKISKNFVGTSLYEPSGKQTSSNITGSCVLIQ